MALPLFLILFMNVVTADEALKLALGSTVISLWVIFFVITVLVSPVGIVHRSACASVRMH